MRRGHPLAVLLLLSLCFTNSDVGARQAGGTDPLFDAHGMQENRSYFSLLPFEQIDMLTGNVILTFTDLVLPGDAGLDVRIGRTYNSKGTAGWRFGLEGVPYSVQNPDGVPAGAPDPQASFPKLQMADGATHDLFPEAQFSYSVFRTRQFWRYHVSGRRLELPDGTVCFYGSSGQLTAIQDAFQNRIDLSYRFNLELERVRQTLGSGQVREVTFGSGGVAGKIPMTMTYLDRTWFYQTDNDGMLSTFRPPAGPDWLFGYDFFNTRVLRFVTTPNGGRVEYVFTLHNFAGAGGVVASRVLQTRRLTTDAFTLPGDWVFDYPPMVGMPAGVTGPDNTRTTFLHGTPPGASEPALLTLQRFQSIFFLEQETFTYEASAVTTWGGGIALRPASRTVTRDNRTFTTTWTYRPTNFGDYGRPHLIQETGEAQRTTEFTYTYNFDPAKWIKDKVESRTVTVNGESARISRTYRFDTGFMDSETRYTIPTQFTPDAHGNVANTTDAHGHITRYTYDWGVLKDTITPMHTVTRVINPDGTVASETQRGFTTSYQYDGLGRRTRVQPPAGLAFQTTYNANETIEFRTDGVRTMRTTSTLDGFGRVIATQNSAGVRTRTNYDALGRKTYQSLPFDQETPEAGTIFRYDGLFRLAETEQAGGQITTYTYVINGDLTIYERNGPELRTTVQRFARFGDPSEGRLVGVTDADQNVWSYEYNVLGRLTRVNAPASQPRSWTYYPGTDLLQFESHPESGTTGFRYQAGRLQFKDTPRGTFSYDYDANDRLTTIGAPVSPHSVTMSYDESDNRTLLRNSYVTSTFQFDGADRLEWRRDTLTNDQLRQTTYGYNGFDDLTRIDYASGRPVTYEYDSESRPRRAFRDGGVLVAEAEAYHPSGGIKRLRLGNNIVEQFTYEPNRHWLTSISGGPVNLCYQYFPVGNIESIKDFDASPANCQLAGGPKSQQFLYDRLDRLSTISGFGANAFLYDANGNRRTKQAPGLTYIYDVFNRLDFVDGAVASPEYGDYVFDPLNGNLQRDPSGTYTHTPSNMLETATVGGVTTTYRYDGDNIRKIRIGQSGGDTLFFHGPDNQLLSEFENPIVSPVRWLRDYVYLGSRLVATVASPSVTFDFTAASSQVGEAGGSVTVTVRMTTRNAQPTTTPVAVSYGTVNGTAVAGSDYTAVSNTINLPAGTASGTTRTIVVPILNDAVFEPLQEAFTIALSNAVNAGVGAGTHAVTIRDDEPEPGGFLDMPAAGQVLRGAFQVGGWAMDRRAATGTGIDAVDLYARAGPNFTAPGTLLGHASYGHPRPDVAAQHGAQFTNTGFGMIAPGLPAGTYDIVASVRIVATGAWTTLAANRVTAETGQAMSIDTPAAGTLPKQLFTVAGYAIDRDAVSGTGVNLVSVTAQPLPGGTPVALGNATYGIARPDVATLYGDQRFLNSGYSLVVSTLPAGQYRLDVSARSTASGALQMRSVTVTIPTRSAVVIDAPANNTTTGQPFLMGGWAVDLAAAAGTGISTVHVWATPRAGGSAVFLGAPAFGPRPDVAAYHGAQFLNCGFTLPSVAGLAPGTWDIIAYAMSTLTGTFNATAGVTITIPVPNAAVSIDAPIEGSTVGQPLYVGGWAIDLASPNTVGVAALHVYAYPWTGAPPIFLGAPLVGGPRPDVAAAFGAHYYYSGWGFHASGLPPGTYTLVAHPISTGNVVVTGAVLRVVTVQ